MLAELCYWKHLALSAATVAILAIFAAITEAVVILGRV